jgi:gliding motility associated protien GldN
MKKFGLIAVSILFCSLSYGQVIESTGGNADTAAAPSVMDAIRPPVDGVYKKVHISKLQPMTLTHIREADVLHATLVWSDIDLREKMNHPFYYPTEVRGNWKSLTQAIFDATCDSTEANPNPVRVYIDEYVTIPYTIQGLNATRGYTHLQPLTNEWGDITGDTLISVSYSASEVYKYNIKDQYVVDKQRSIQEARIFVIAPMYWLEPNNTTYEDQPVVEEGDDMEQLGPPRRWRRFGYIYFPEIRPLLATTEVFNPQNNGQRRTYDDMFMQRHFSSVITAVENVHDNRQISEYIVNGMDQRLEADAIKEKIRSREVELWEY